MSGRVTGDPGRGSSLSPDPASDQQQHHYDHDPHKQKEAGHKVLIFLTCCLGGTTLLLPSLVATVIMHGNLWKATIK